MTLTCVHNTRNLVEIFVINRVIGIESNTPITFTNYLICNDCYNRLNINSSRGKLLRCSNCEKKNILSENLTDNLCYNCFNETLKSEYINKFSENLYGLVREIIYNNNRINEFNNLILDFKSQIHLHEYIIRNELSNRHDNNHIELIERIDLISNDSDGFDGLGGFDNISSSDPDDELDDMSNYSDTMLFHIYCNRFRVKKQIKIFTKDVLNELIEKHKSIRSLIKYKLTIKYLYNNVVNEFGSLVCDYKKNLREYFNNVIKYNSVTDLIKDMRKFHPINKDDKLFKVREELFRNIVQVKLLPFTDIG